MPYYRSVHVQCGIVDGSESAQVLREVHDVETGTGYLDLSVHGQHFAVVGVVVRSERVSDSPAELLSLRNPQTLRYLGDGESGNVRRIEIGLDGELLNSFGHPLRRLRLSPEASGSSLRCHGRVPPSPLFG